MSALPSALMTARTARSGFLKPPLASPLNSCAASSGVTSTAPSSMAGTCGRRLREPEALQRLRDLGQAEIQAHTDGGEIQRLASARTTGTGP